MSLRGHQDAISTQIASVLGLLNVSAGPQGRDIHANCVNFGSTQCLCGATRTRYPRKLRQFWDYSTSLRGHKDAISTQIASILAVPNVSAGPPGRDIHANCVSF